MMNELKKIVVRAFIVFTITILAIDSYRVVDTLASKSKEIWFTESWLVAPLTLFLLESFGEERMRETVNGDRSEVWLVREIEFAGKVFWTVHKRTPIPK